jgi:hypothetical protein
MYFPYLYGKQRELIAIRNALEDISQHDYVRPVVEPVRRDPSSLRITIDRCEEAGHALYVVVNPNQSQFRNMPIADSYSWGMDVCDYSVYEYIRPVFLLSEAATLTDFRRFLRQFRGQEIAVLFRAASIPATLVAEEVENFTVTFFFHGPEPSVASVRALGKNRCVWVEDRFPSQSRNADYGGRTLFTDRHLTWARSGYAGFSDYTVLDSMVRDGGGPPGAVAFHMTHFDLAGAAAEIYVEHFVSDRQRQEERDNDGKFMEALAKYIVALRRRTTSFGLTAAAEEFSERFEAQNPPSLALSKNLQIQHHMAMINGALAGQFP